LASQYTKQYTSLLYGYTLKYSALLNNPQKLSELPASIKGNVLKAMVALSKFLGCYEDFKLNLKQHGIHWVNNDNSFNSFLRIVNNNHSSLGAWYTAVQSILRPNEKLWLKFNLLSGLRKEESINSFNLIIQLSQDGKLGEYYNQELEVLEHFKHGELFLRHTKNCYISIVPNDLVQTIANSQPVSYSAIRKRLTRKGQPLRIKELRSYSATYLRTHGILAEYVDLIQGRIPKSVFARHYLKVEDLKMLVKQVLAVTATMESSLLS
jgi:hypothetical protein